MAAAAHEHEPAPAKVEFIAPDHSHWTVHETRDPTGPTGAALLFVSDRGFRRVRTFPRDWRALDPDALWALSWER
jgi:hypothetical protein